MKITSEYEILEDILKKINSLISDKTEALVNRYGDYIGEDERNKETFLKDMRENKQLREEVLNDCVEHEQILNLIREFEDIIKSYEPHIKESFEEELMDVIEDSVTLPFDKKFIIELIKISKISEEVYCKFEIELNINEKMEILKSNYEVFFKQICNEKFLENEEVKKAIKQWFYDKVKSEGNEYIEDEFLKLPNHIQKKLGTDKEFVLKTGLIEGASRKLKNDLEFIKELFYCICKNEYIEYDKIIEKFETYVPERIQNALSNDKEFIIRTGLIDEMSDKLNEDKEVIKELIKKNKLTAFSMYNHDIILDKEIAMVALRNGWEGEYFQELEDIYDDLNDKERRQYNELFSDPKVMLAFLEADLEYFKILDMCNWRLFGNREFIDDVKKSEKLKQLKDEEFWKKFEQYIEDFQELINDKLDDELENRIGEKIVTEMMEKISETKTVVTHFGDDLDNKASVFAIEEFAKVEGILEFDEKLNVERVPAGQIKEGMLNIDTGGHNGTRLENGTIVIDGDVKNGIRSAAYMLKKLGIYVPDQVLELADTVPTKVSSLDSRSGMALLRYLNGEQIFILAEKGLLNSSLTDEQLEEYDLVQAHEKQQKIIDNALKKIEQYTKTLPNGEKIVLAPEQIIGGSAIAYEVGVNYYVYAENHSDENGDQDGVTFAITSKPGVKLPNSILEYGKKLEEEYRIDKYTSGVFVNPNEQMIVAGGFKNPNFKIRGENVNSILSKVENQFAIKEIGKGKEVID